MRTFQVLRKFGAVEIIAAAKQLLQEKDLARGALVGPNGELDITAAIFLAAHASPSKLASCGGDPIKAGLSPMNAQIAHELIKALEALVNEDITTWGDANDLKTVLRALDRLSGYFQ